MTQIITKSNVLRRSYKEKISRAKECYIYLKWVLNFIHCDLKENLKKSQSWPVETCRQLEAATKSSDFSLQLCVCQALFTLLSQSLCFRVCFSSKGVNYTFHFQIFVHREVKTVSCSLINL